MCVCVGVRRCVYVYVKTDVLPSCLCVFHTVAAPLVCFLSYSGDDKEVRFQATLITICTLPLHVFSPHPSCTRPRVCCSLNELSAWLEGGLPGPTQVEEVCVNYQRLNPTSFLTIIQHWFIKPAFLNVWSVFDIVCNLRSIVSFVLLYILSKDLSLSVQHYI